MKKNGGTVSATARIPVRVIEWENFGEEVRRFALSRQQHFEGCGFIPRVKLPPSITSEDNCVKLCSEKDLQSLTDEWLFTNLNHLTWCTESKFFLFTTSKERCGINLQCSPDGVTVLMQRGNAGQKSNPVKVQLCWENKPE
jgi:hypothetical protein